jgi:RNA-directed DNA polymerase
MHVERTATPRKRRQGYAYYSHFYTMQLRLTLKSIDAYVIRWARRKFKRMRHQANGARDWFERLHRASH